MTEANDVSTSSDAGALRNVALRDILEAMAVPGVGPVSARRLLARYGSVAEARKGDKRDLQATGLNRTALSALREKALSYEPAEEIEKARRHNVRIVPLGASDYPAPLRNLHDAPPALYIKGSYLPRDVVALAVVGSRRASVYGLTQAERLAGDLARAGFTIISGLARGIDSIAHRASLKTGGRTIAVLGNGLAGVYPSEHAGLAERIIENGAVVGELPMDTVPSARGFPARNRLIAGLSLGVLVVEASRRSGALITARLAAETGREIFAVPGDVGRPQTRGTHGLIRDGAKLVEGIEDIIEELGPLAAPVSMGRDSSSLSDARVLTLNARERAVYDVLASSPKDIDRITRESGLPPANVAGTLTVLEMKRLAIQRPGKQYVRSGSIER